MTLDTITFKQTLYGAVHTPTYIEFFDTTDKRIHLMSIKTFKSQFKLSDEQLEQFLKEHTCYK